LGAYLGNDLFSDTVKEFKPRFVALVGYLTAVMRVVEIVIQFPAASLPGDAFAGMGKGDRTFALWGR
jgi:hypothetical protein